MEINLITNLIYFIHKIKCHYIYHIFLKERNDITSIFLNEDQKKLSINDFQYIYSHLNKHILKELLEKRIIQLNNKELDENQYGFYKNYMYTIMEKEIVEKKINDINIRNLKEGLLCNQSETNYFVNINEDRRDYKSFILSNNIQYLRSLNFEEVILYIIFDKLKEFIQLPNIIFYECLMNIMGQTNIISDTNLPPGYQKIDYAFYINIIFLLIKKKVPFMFNLNIITMEMNL